LLSDHPAARHSEAPRLANKNKCPGFGVAETWAGFMEAVPSMVLSVGIFCVARTAWKMTEV
jgi:hypothetical protein